MLRPTTMKRIYRPGLNRTLDDLVPGCDVNRCTGERSSSGLSRTLRGGNHGVKAVAAVAVWQVALFSPVHAQAVTFLDLSGGLTGWTTAGTVSVLSTTDAFNINGTPYSLTPAAGDSMAKISPAGAAAGSVDSLLGLGADSIESLLNNSNGNVTNFGVMTKSFSFDPGTYSFSWA